MKDTSDNKEALKVMGTLCLLVIMLTATLGGLAWILGQVF